jgi:hypothetical protein
MSYLHATLLETPIRCSCELHASGLTRLDPSKSKGSLSVPLTLCPEFPKGKKQETLPCGILTASAGHFFTRLEFRAQCTCPRLEALVLVGKLRSNSGEKPTRGEN